MNRQDVCADRRTFSKPSCRSAASAKADAYNATAESDATKMRRSLAMRVHVIVAGIAVGIVLLLSQAPVWAHHAFAAEFVANKPLRFDDATVTKVQLINPHSWINVDVKFPDGRVENWAIEAGSPNILLRRGITRDTLKVGTKIVVEGYQ